MHYYIHILYVDPIIHYITLYQETHKDTNKNHPSVFVCVRQGGIMENEADFQSVDLSVDRCCDSPTSQTTSEFPRADG